MANEGKADVALLQECGNPPIVSLDFFQYDSKILWDKKLYDRWPLVVKLSDRVDIQWFQQVPPISGVEENTVATSGIGTSAIAKVIPCDHQQKPFIVVSMYARWMMPHPSTNTKWKVGQSDTSAHRIISDLSAFIGHDDPSNHRILAAGDLNLIWDRHIMAERERTVWARMEALGLEFLGPQLPNGRPITEIPSYLSPDTKNVPTYHTISEKPLSATRQLDYVFASRGFHKEISVQALNNPEEWGPSDHCRLLIKVGE
ncbi:MAG: hypothetical protein OXE92_00375 [Bacteroidetes bacterium]|nr:hypothetical protein [Bacteroidota bacterium]